MRILYLISISAASSISYWKHKKIAIQVSIAALSDKTVSPTHTLRTRIYEASQLSTNEKRTCVVVLTRHDTCLSAASGRDSVSQ